MNIKQALRTVGTVGLIAGGIWVEGAGHHKQASAQMMDQTTSANCPQIFYREPFTSRVAAPAGCPFTEYQQALQNDQPDSLEALQTSAPMTSETGLAPLPEERSEPVAMAMPMEGELMVSLVNNTGTAVNYEVIGNTPRRMIEAGESAMLQGIPLPSTITLVRPDDGLLQIGALSTEEGTLEIVLTPETTLDSNQGVVRIQEDGSVFVN